MTTSAHNARRVYGGASLAKNMEPPERPAAPHSLYRDLHPEMFKDKPKPVSPLAQAIKAWLIENGPATATEIAVGTEQQYVSSVAYSLKNSVEGVSIVGHKRSPKGIEVAVWGITQK